MNDTAVQLRKFPFPYRAMLALSSDIDRTDIRRFRNIHRFLNTEAETALGRGVGLDIADSMWVLPGASREMSLLTQNDQAMPQPYADELAAYARSGWVDTLHTYGNYSAPTVDLAGFERGHAEVAIEELLARGLHFTIWVNHGNKANLQNFGLRDQLGDLPGSRAYHTDLLLEYGVRYMWNHGGGRQSGVDNPLTPVTLRDGRKLWGFTRYSAVAGEAAARGTEAQPESVRLYRKIQRTAPDGETIAMLWWPELLDWQLDAECLDRLVAASQYCIVAQHLGDLHESGAELPPPAVLAARRLRDYQDTGLILVARTSRLLEYARVSQHLVFDVRGNGAQVYVDIRSVADPVLGTFVPTLDQLRGVTFYVTSPSTTHLLLNGTPIRNAELLRSDSDGTAPSIGIRWFEPDRTDYTTLFPEGHGAVPQVDVLPPLDLLPDDDQLGEVQLVSPAEADAAEFDEAATDHVDELVEEWPDDDQLVDHAGESADAGTDPGARPAG